jgi:hypothetical protein
MVGVRFYVIRDPASLRSPISNLLTKPMNLSEGSGKKPDSLKSLSA